MPVAEVFLSAVLPVIFEKLASAAIRKTARSQGIFSQLNKWENWLSLILTVLVDAEQMQITNKPVQLWLHDLQNLAYDIDDILDDLATEALHRELNAKDSGGSTSQVRKLIPTCCTSFSPRNLKYGDKMGSKLEEITSRLQDLIEKKSILGLRENATSLTDRRGESRQTTSLVDESRIIGREADKDALLRLVLSTETCNKNLSIISVVGMGGLGKTTLAQLVYNSKEAEDKFDLMAWVCISDDFDVFRITNTIYGHVAGQDRQDFKDLNTLQVALKQKLSEKRFLIVLDDLWTEDFQKWELLQQPFQGGARGSKIITTTRNMSVVSTIRCDRKYHLNILTDEQSLSLFSMYATGTKDFNANPTLRLLGEDIAKKCKGLPLALIMLGRVLQDKTSDEDWRVLLHNEIWDLQEKENVILPALRISYHHLPAHLRKLFAYCSLFVKDYLFDADELVLLWLAEGFLKHSDDKLTTEDLGRKCFEELLSRSFFQQSASKESRYLMHDLTHDLATFVAGEFFFRLDNKMNVHGNNEALKKLRHFSFACQKYEVYTRFNALHGAKRLRTFLPVSIAAYPEFYMSNKVLIELLPQLQFLRVLSLRNYHIKEIPESIGSLKHLRYLNFSDTDIEYLPEQISYLYNLQTLLPSGCWYLTKLPNNFLKLINLRHLDISNTPKLQKMPFGIGGLTGLQTLSKVITKERDGFKLTELKGLSGLRGRLEMKGLLNVTNPMHAKEANLFEKKGLDDVEMEWSDVFDSSRKERIELEVLEALRPQDELKRLKIVYYGGIEFPSWVGKPLLDGLTELTLSGCKRCTSLPSLGHLPSLKKLIVEDMDGVKSIGGEFLGDNGKPFPSLTTLELCNMKGWEIWSMVGNDNGIVFPCLSELRIQGCPNLVEVSIHSIPSLWVLDIRGCSTEVLRSIVRVASSITKLIIFDIRGLTKLQRGVIEFLRGVKYLCLRDCKELRYLWESEEEASKMLVNLRVLQVWDCPELICLGEKEKEKEKEKEDGENVNCLTSLEKFELSECPRLEYCFSMKRMQDVDRRDGECACIFPNLETLRIWRCSGIKWLPTGQKKLPSTLKRLDVIGCENLLLLEALVVGGGSSSSTISSMLANSSKQLSLEGIWIWECRNLIKRWPELGSFLHLTSLIIMGCEGIESFPQQQSQGQGGVGGVGFFPTGLQSLQINNCKNLKWFPNDELPTLTSLVYMDITDLPSLDLGGLWFPKGVVWPPNLRELMIGGLKKPMAEWGPLNKFPNSLVDLCLWNEFCLVSFGEETQEMVIGGTTTTTTATGGFILSSSLVTLRISDFENLESLSKGLQHLASLEQLVINNCPKLRDLPDTLLPQLSHLKIRNSPKLKERCSSNINRRDSYWPAISHIPCLRGDISNT